MPIYIDQGDGRFIVDYTFDDAPKPPMQEPVANVSPVYQEKNRVANEAGYTQGARENLYRSPVDIYYTQESPYADEGLLGSYHSQRNLTGEWLDRDIRMPFARDPYISLWAGLGPERTTGILEHENAHRIYFEDLDRSQRQKWREDYPNVVNEAAIAAVHPDAYPNQRYSLPVETYAYNVTPGYGYGYDESQEKYYPNVYAPRPEPPAANPLQQADTERVVAFDPAIMAEVVGRRYERPLTRDDMSSQSPWGYLPNGSTLLSPAYWAEPVFGEGAYKG